MAVDTTTHLWILVPALGFALAFGFGFAAHRTGFCAMGAISDVVNMGEWSRMRMWLLAVAMAILGTNLISIVGWVDLRRSMYATERFALASYIVGGFAFGVGMTLASGCGSRNLARLGAGSLKALVVLLCLAVSAYMTMKGILSVPRPLA